MKTSKRKQGLGIGIGVGVLGALALAVRYGIRRVARAPIPDSISPAIFATRVARTGFGEMIYHVSGSGQPLVFLHGVFLGASSYEWSKIYPRFVMGHEVIVPDLMGSASPSVHRRRWIIRTTPRRSPIFCARWRPPRSRSSSRAV